MPPSLFLFIFWYGRPNFRFNCKNPLRVNFKVTLNYVQFLLTPWIQHFSMCPHYSKDKKLIERMWVFCVVKYIWFDLIWIQRRFTKMIPSVRNLPYETIRLKKLGLWSLLTLEHRRVRADLIEVYKIIHGLSSVKFDTFFLIFNIWTDPWSFSETHKESSKNWTETTLLQRRVINV